MMVGMMCAVMVMNAAEAHESYSCFKWRAFYTQAGLVVSSGAGRGGRDTRDGSDGRDAKDGRDLSERKGPNGSLIYRL